MFQITLEQHENRSAWLHEITTRCGRRRRVGDGCSDHDRLQVFVERVRERCVVAFTRRCGEQMTTDSPVERVQERCAVASTRRCGEQKTTDSPAADVMIIVQTSIDCMYILDYRYLFRVRYLARPQISILLTTKLISSGGHVSQPIRGQRFHNSAASYKS